MNMAKMTGCQPDFRTSLTDGERWAILTHSGMRSRKKPHTAGGRYHMSGDIAQNTSVKIFDYALHVVHKLVLGERNTFVLCF